MRYLEVVEEILDNSFGVLSCLASKTLLALTVVKFHHCNPIFIIQSQMQEGNCTLRWTKVGKNTSIKIHFIFLHMISKVFDFFSIVSL